MKYSILILLLIWNSAAWAASAGCRNGDAFSIAISAMVASDELRGTITPGRAGDDVFVEYAIADESGLRWKLLMLRPQDQADLELRSDGQTVAFLRSRRAMDRGNQVVSIPVVGLFDSELVSACEADVKKLLLDLKLERPDPDSCLNSREARRWGKAARYKNANRLVDLIVDSYANDKNQLAQLLYCKVSSQRTSFTSINYEKRGMHHVGGFATVADVILFVMNHLSTPGIIGPEMPYDPDQVVRLGDAWRLLLRQKVH